ncbi:MAG: class I fructose-bisphosphate aldolase [bacterium]|nr:class I fructose-bisphosphate aldolase [bacterium]
MDLKKLQQTAKAMVARGKGILAIDESFGNSEKRFGKVGVPHTEENRRAYRQLLITAPGIEQYISGMILFDETLRQKTADGVPFPDALKERGMIPGIKVDKGTKDLALHPNEVITEGLDGLRERFAEYAALGAQFAKWRAVITIGDGIPTVACIRVNAHALARYAALAQEAGLVPMVEPEILIDGGHSIERCAEVCAATWDALFAELKEQGVELSGTILKTSMVLSGNACPDQADVETVARMTIDALKTHVPAEVAGVVFLSGGQDDEKATLHLNAMHILGEKLPWPLSFSYGRGIQNPALTLWAQDTKNNVAKAQAAAVERSRANAFASEGKYK